MHIFRRHGPALVAYRLYEASHILGHDWSQGVFYFKLMYLWRQRLVRHNASYLSLNEML